MKLIMRQTVEHKTFGKGVVTNVTSRIDHFGRTITYYHITFDCGTKVFVDWCMDEFFN